MKKVILLGLCMIFLVGIVNADLYYQENSNTTGLGGAWIDGLQTYDGNWDNYGYAMDFSSASYDMNYTKMIGTYSVIWRVKDETAEINITIPTVCWNYDDDEIHLKYVSSSPQQADRIQWQCMAKGGLQTLRQIDAINNIYEEGVYWNDTFIPPPTPPQLNITSISKTSKLTINQGGMLTISK